MALGTRNNLEHFRDVPFKTSYTGFFTFTFLEEAVCLQHSGTMVEQIFMQFSSRELICDKEQPCIFWGCCD